MKDVNRQVAKKVMGWGYDPRGGIGGPNEPAWIDQDSSWILVKDFDPMHRIEHAWMVVEKGDWFCNKVLYQYGGKWGVFEVKYLRGYGDLLSTNPMVIADTAQEAICLAALKSVKEGEKDQPSLTPSSQEWEEWIEKMPGLRFYNAAMYDEHMKFWFRSMPCVPKG